MTRKLLIVSSSLSALMLSFGAHFFSGSVSNSFLLDRVQEAREKERGLAKEAAEYRFSLLADENGEVKPEYFAQALRQADLLKKQKGSRAGALNLQWEELGPNNIGGRTRGIIVDNRDPQRNTVYAGAVGGGLWKSTNKGDSWTNIPLPDVITISCMAQDKAGNIYLGTGEGLAQIGGTRYNSGSVGNGIYKFNDDNNIVHLQSTKQSSPYVSSEMWSAVNRIAIDPNNNDHIFAATQGGVMESNDGGNTWTSIVSKVKNQNGTTPNPGTLSNAADIDFSSDGQIIYASVGASGACKGVNLIRSLNAGSTWDIIPTSNNNVPPSGSNCFLPNFAITKGRIEIATSFTNPGVAYLSMCNSSGGNFHGYKTTDGGCSWIKIGEAGSTFNPFGDNSQGWYDNVIIINPADDDQVYMGGIQLFAYSSNLGWKVTSVYFGEPNNNFWVHADMHGLAYNDLDKNQLYVGCDGGVFRTDKAFDNFPNPPFYVKNRGYSVTQAYSVAAGPNGEVMCGNQDNGTTYVNYNFSSKRAAKSIRGGDGVATEISTIDPNVFIYGVYYGDIVRSNNKGVAGSYFYDNAIDPNGLNHPSRCGNQQFNTRFITNFYLEETYDAPVSLDSVKFIADRDYAPGEIASVTGRFKVNFDYSIPQFLTAGDQIMVPDPIKSRLYLPTNCGLWMTPDILDFGGATRWFRIKTSVNPTALSQSFTGDTVYFANGSTVHRITGMNSIAFDSAMVKSGTTSVPWNKMPTNTSSTFSVNTGGKTIEGLYVDRRNSNHVLAVASGFSNSGGTSVFKSTNGGTSWTNITSNLPNVPVYDCVIDAYNPNNYIIGTEIGVFASADGGASWEEYNEATQRVPVYAVRQLRYLDRNCYMLYLGTHGRGMWRSSTLMQSGCQLNALGIKDKDENPAFNQLALFPVPMKENGTIEIDIDKKADVVFRVIDMPGRVVKEITIEDVQSGKSQYKLDVSNLSNGTYILTATLDKKNSFSRVFTISK